MAHSQRLKLIAALATASILAACHGPASPPAPRGGSGSLASVEWLAGSWIANDGVTTTEEVWTLPRGETMFGINRTVAGNETVFYEFLCIQNTRDGVFYLASPQGRQPPTPFKLTSSQNNRIVFENPDHDFPNRIIYEIKGNQMLGRIEGTRSGKPALEEWTWRRVK